LVTAIGGGGLLAWKQMKPKPPVAAELPESRSYNSGGEVHAEYTGKGGTLLFKLQEGGDVGVTISGNRNDFNYRWDGTGELKIVNLEPGPYRVRVRSGSTRVNLESRVQRRKICSYQYNLSSGKDRWTKEGCN